MKSVQMQIALFLGTIILLGGAFVGGWGAFSVLEMLRINVPLPGGRNIQTTAPVAAEAEADTEMALFWEAMDLLDKNFYAQEELPRGPDLTYAAIQGVVEAAGDPHTGFMDPERAEIAATGLEGEFEGIGAQVDMSEEGLVIVAPFPGTPAAEAGLLAGDLVLEVDGEPTLGLDLMEAVARVRGPRGTVVTLLVRREGEPETLTFNITRANIVIPIVETRMIEDPDAPKIGYIKLTDFGAKSVEQFREGLQGLLDEGAEALIVDLRNNPGGYLQASVEITSEFIGEGIILSEKGSNNRDLVHHAESGGLALDIPLVVLINEGSASASEIFAGAIRDAERGTLIGATSFGKGSVQITRNLSDKSSLRVTVARWFTPSGSAIHEVGVEPDIRVEWDPTTTEPGADPQLEAAIEFLKEQ